MKFERKKYNAFDLSGKYGIGIDCDGNKFYFDKDDFNRINKHYWAKDKNGYWRSSINRLHRFILNAEKNEYVDHINNNKDDNRKFNLRKCDNSENNRNRGLQSNNTSGCTGVSWDKRSNKWRVRIKLYGKEKEIGKYADINDAIKARKDAEEKYYGEFSYDKSMEMNIYV